MKDILLDDDGDLKLENGDFVIGDSLEQEVALLLQLNKGEIKLDPLVGCDLIKIMKSNASNIEIKKIVKLQLSRDGKNYETLKNQIKQ